ncbi:hypothetical protein [Peterkaempfera sp. SMS 1(5)a]|uniref:hypothetical protein n=1 Tax=Peterkaempfera podocarpi TaxID=3232308 RepID=UPI00366B3A28
MTIKDGPQPDPWELVGGTDWALLEHACGSAAESPGLLVGLLADDPGMQARALRHLHDPVHHQNTIYSATVPAALYVAAALGDPRTATALPARELGGAYPLRAALLDWLGSVATEVGNEAESVMARLGLCLAEHPESVAVRALRPALFRVVSGFLHDPDPAVQAAAIAAAVPLLDAPELLRHRAALAPLMREVLAADDNRSQRAITAYGLATWGEDRDAVQAVQGPAPWAEGCGSEPPF